MLTLTAPITVPNINKVDPYKAHDNRDDATPSFGLTVKFQAVGGRDAGTFTITAFNTQNSSSIGLNPSPASLSDMIVAHGATQVNNACTLIGDAYDAAAGNRTAKRAAAYAKAVEIGLIGAGLAAT